MSRSAPATPAEELFPPVGAPLARRAVGEGRPVVVAAHGLGGSATQVAPLLRRAQGRRVLVDLRGHGASPPLDAGFDYEQLADDLLEVVDAERADAVLGLSLGAGTVLRALHRRRDAVRAAVLVMPSGVDRAPDDASRERLDRLGRAVDRRDVHAVLELLLDEVPPDLRGRAAVVRLVRARAEVLVRRPAPWPRRQEGPLASWDLVAGLDLPVLVVVQEADPLHPAEVGRGLAEALPQGRLVETGEGGVFFGEARRVQDAVASFLSEVCT